MLPKHERQSSKAKKYEIRQSAIAGNGLFAQKAIGRGETVLQTRAKVVYKRIESEAESSQIINWIGIDRDTWMNTDNTPLRYINHSCEPNSAMASAKTLVALRHIEVGEEITMDYSMSDADPLWSISCNCGSKNCRKLISSIHTIDTQVFKDHFPFVSKPFQRIFIQKYISENDDER